MSPSTSWFVTELDRRGISRRELLWFCGGVATLFALPRSAKGAIAGALVKAQKPSVVWLEFQDCCGDTESFLRATRPTAAAAVLDVLSIDYHETLMAAAGHQAETARDAAISSKSGYIAIVEGSIPSGANGAYCTIGGRSALRIAQEVIGGASATIALGTCATSGGLAAAHPNPTGAMGVEEAVPGVENLINLPGCPANVENLTALIVYRLTFHRWPQLDREHRPLFAHGKTIHDNCERRAHYDAGQYAERWGDEGHRAGYCLYKLGCKGPVTFHNCPTVRWNDGTSWPVGCGHPCVGCAEAGFWDKMTPFYAHLTGIPGFGLATPIDKVGLYTAGAVGAAFLGHGLVQIGKHMGKKDPTGHGGEP